MPFIHAPTWRLLETPLEVALALATVSAQYSFEHRVSEKLFRAGKAILLKRLARETGKIGPNTTTFLSVHNPLDVANAHNSKWLRSLKDSVGNSRPLSDSEDRILHWVNYIVEEAWDIVDFDEAEPVASIRSDPSNLGAAVLKIWAHFFKSNTQWPFINTIGLSLDKYRETLPGGTKPRCN
ncbi:hypothetical protein DL766_006666 [Monosporascus sp. MC13-8B]|uniref:Uncharacterized protein n=1 Tax=Monosporascus cannonballus TaxID=155416 RepID=A0ABY0H3R9_9PEZI|nr:hypothetical protein DL763_010520 [Monosporascus cannonballus]RYO81489.1 hypothetical protein DL762_007066 [Monosporascus cannonballus]RYP26586.1 hypothetical protein DL766_006666 [Monosporascus sp. MC13-8B]